MIQVTLRGLVLAAALAGAPFQCRRAPDPERAIEETPAEALYDLAVRFRARGDVAAWRATLEHLRERYPGSRQAVMATTELGTSPGAASSASGP
jgi:hypothetical protein